MSWSSGKDSAYALAAVQQEPGVEVVGLLVTMNASADRVSMHAVRRALVVTQAERLGLPVHLVELPSPCPNDRYEHAMRGALAVARDAGVDQIVFGDLFLADIRAYRERALAETGFSARFPLWNRPTDVLAREMLDSGIKAVVTCVDPSQVPAEFAGRPWDEELLADLPPAADPCGENGEFHTFVSDGPGFRAPIPVVAGPPLERDGFVYSDVSPVS